MAIRYYEGGEVLREIAPKAIFGSSLCVKAEGDCDLFYVSLSPEADYIKANQAGSLSVRTKRIPTCITVCEKPGGPVIVECMSVDGTDFSLTIGESDVNYWFEVRYETGPIRKGVL